SDSMHGRPIAAAMAAARAFAAHRTDGQSLGVIAFNGAVTVLQPLTTDSTAISTSLSRTPTLRYGTRIYDALVQAAAMLRAARANSGSMLLVPPGAAVGSNSTPGAAPGGLVNDRVRVFRVGLVSSAYDRHTLATAAAKSHGSYVATGHPSALTPIFDRLGF